MTHFHSVSRVCPSHCLACFGNFFAKYLRMLFPPNFGKQMRAHFYTLNSLVMDDENVQMKGIVVVGFIEQLSKLDLALQWNLAKMRSAFPIRFAAVHFCYKKTQSLQAISILMLAISKATRKRMRWHNGTCDGRKERIDCSLFRCLNSCHPPFPIL